MRRGRGGRPRRPGRLAKGCSHPVALRWGRKPVHRLAQEEGDGRDASGPHAAAFAVFKRLWGEGRVRRDPAPHDLPGKTELVEIRRVVIPNAAVEDLALPCRCGNFVTLQLPDDLQRAFGAVQLRARRHVLPAAEEAVQVERADRFDFATQTAERHVMNAGEDTAITPLDFAIPFSYRETSLEDLPLAFDSGERPIDFFAAEGKPFG